MPAIGTSNWSALASTEMVPPRAGLPVWAGPGASNGRRGEAGEYGATGSGPFARDWNLAGRGECSKRPEEGSTSRPWWVMQSGRARIPGFGRRPYTADLVSQRPQLGCLLEIVETLALTLIIFVVIQNFIAQPYKVQQSSMERTLMQEQYVLVDKLTPRFDAYKRGDIVVFTPPEDWVGADRTPFIKRVIGVGGDTVEVHDGGVYINDERLDEPYIYTESDGSVQTTDAAQERWVIPATNCS